MHVQYVRHVFGMQAMHRKNQIRTLVDDLVKSSLVSIGDLNAEITPKWKQRRKKMTELQRLFCDQAELFTALNDAYQALYYITLAAQTKDGIKPYLWAEVDQQVYEARFKLFENIMVPRYVTYEEYRETMEHEIETLGFDQLYAQAKQYSTAAQQRLAKLIALDSA